MSMLECPECLQTIGCVCTKEMTEHNQRVSTPLEELEVIIACLPESPFKRQAIATREAIERQLAEATAAKEAAEKTKLALAAEMTELEESELARGYGWAECKQKLEAAESLILKQSGILEYALNHLDFAAENGHLASKELARDIRRHLLEGAVPVSQLPAAPVCRYRVGTSPKRCGCHWETCNCDDWAVFDGDKVHSTHSRESDAQEMADALNGVAPVKGDKIDLKGA